MKVMEIKEGKFCSYLTGNINEWTGVITYKEDTYQGISPSITITKESFSETSLITVCGSMLYFQVQYWILKHNTETKMTTTLYDAF